METSQNWFKRAQKVAPGGVHSPVRAFKSVGGHPLFFRSAQGAYLETVEGQRYIDFCQSFGPHLLGHRDADVARVVHETVDMAWSFGACEPYSVELAEWVTERLPWVEKIRFVSSGTEAVMSALRVARAATGRNKILKFTGCYHGHADSLLVKAGSGLAGSVAADSAGLDSSVLAQTLVADLDDENSVSEVFKRCGSDIAAVILEPLPANYGLLAQRTEFIQHVIKQAREYGALVVFDEVISGFRVARGGMAEIFGVRPDLLTYGKVLGGGFPVGAYGGRKDLLDLVAPMGPVYQAGTLSANPVGMRAGLATLQKAERLNLWSDLEKRTQSFAQGLNEFCFSKDIKLQMSTFGSLFWLHHADFKTPRSLRDISGEQGEIFKHVFTACLAEGVYLAPSGYEVGFLSAAHTPAVLEEAAAKIKTALMKAYERK